MADRDCDGASGRDSSKRKLKPVEHASKRQRRQDSDTASEHGGRAEHGSSDGDDVEKSRVVKAEIGSQDVSAFEYSNFEQDLSGTEEPEAEESSDSWSATDEDEAETSEDDDASSVSETELEELESKAEMQTVTELEEYDDMLDHNEEAMLWEFMGRDRKGTEFS